jgi:predicted DsbA family dithiol-disulfide isomerase
MKEAGASVGINFTGKTDRAPNTLAAHALSEYAGRQEADKGEEGLQDRLMEVLFRQYFTDGVYPDSAGLRAAAAEVGLDVAAATAYFEDEDNWAEVRSADRNYKQGGIISVPYFMVNGAGVFSGARPPEQLVQAFNEAYTDSSDEED